MKNILLAATGFVLLGSVAHANISFTESNVPQQGLGEENIQFEATDLLPNLVQTGDTNQTNTPVIFDTNFIMGTGSAGGGGTNQLIEADGEGQGNLVTADGSQLTSLEMKPGLPTLAWQDVIGNLDSAGTPNGTANIFVQDNLGHNFTYVLKNGNDFFTLVASGGEVITDVQITQLTGSASPFGWDDFKQPRVSGVCTLVGTTCTPVPPVTEPASLALLGVSLLGLGFVRRRFS